MNVSPQHVRGDALRSCLTAILGVRAFWKSLLPLLSAALSHESASLRSRSGLILGCCCAACDAHCSSGTCCSGSSTTPTSTRHTPRVRKCARLRGSAARRVPVRGRRRARRRRQPRRHAHTHDANIGMGLERRIVRALTSKTCAYRIPTRISYTLLSIAADAPTRIFAACFAAPKAKAQGFFFGLALVPPAADVPGVMPSFASCSSLRSFGSHASGT